MTTLIAFLFVLGVLIFVHELGHYAMAKWQGVRVLTFSLGFGPKILNIHRNGTDYCISAIPLGGYVKMAGENPEDPRSGQPDEFLSKTKWQRFQILIMGPAMNILLAFVVTAVVLYQGVEMPAYEDQIPVVGSTMPDSPAAQVGLRRGDRILTVAGEDVSTWQQVDMAIGIRPNRDVPIMLLREGQPVSVTVRPRPETRFELGSIGVVPEMHPVVRALPAGDPAERAGVKLGDEILAVNGEPVFVHADLVKATAPNAGKPLDYLIRRGSQELHIQITPVLRDGRGMIGLSSSAPTKSFKPGPLEAVAMSAQRTVEGSALIFKTIGQLVSGEASPRQLMGPVAIAQLSGEQAQAGLIALLALMSMISLNLGILNLMPIPVLDGGHILILALEGIARRDFSMQVKEKMFLAGFVLLMMLMVTVIYNDLTRISWIERLMPWRN